MRKPRGFFARALAATIVFWLGLVLTSPVPLDACPMHGSHAVHGGSQGAHPSHAGAGKHDGKQLPTSRQCTCIGDCSTADVQFALIPKQVEAPRTVIIATGERAVGGALTQPARAPDYRLPPANAPPSVS